MTKPFSPFELTKTPVTGRFLIEASAGTGKTFSLIRIVLRLLIETDTTIDEVLLVTFTKAAAAELKARLRELLILTQEASRRAQLGTVATDDPVIDKLLTEFDADFVHERVQAALDSFDDCMVCTIHSFCQQMLQEFRFSSMTGLDAEIGDAQSIVKKVADSFLRDELQRATLALREELLSATDAPLEVFLNALLSKSEHVRARLYNPEGEGHYSEAFEAMIERFIETAPARVREIQQQKGLRTFDDLLCDMERELANPHFVRAIALRFKAVLIDEFQDTDPIQYQIFKTLFLQNANEPNRALIFVGDPKQSIYRFRGADLNTYEKARDDIGCVYHLGCNFRSTPALLTLMNLYFADDPSLNHYTFGKESITYQNVKAASRKTPLFRIENGVKSVLPVIDIWMRKEGEGLSIPASRTQEAELIASEIDALLRSETYLADNQRLTAKDIAILVRRHSQTEEIVAALAKKNIRALIESKSDVLKTTEAAEILQILRAMETPHDHRRMLRARTTRIMGETANDVAPGLLPSDKDSETLEKLPLIAREVIEKAREVFSSRGIAAAFALIFESYQTQSRLLPVSGGEKRLNNYRHIIELLQDKSTSLKTLSGLTRWFERSHKGKDSDAQERQVRLENNDDVVTVMTIHKSKGLEFPVVFMAGAFQWREGKKFPEHVFNSVDEKGNPLMWLSYRAMTNKTFTEIEHEELLEGLRLVYVGLTRASQRLVLPFLMRNKPESRDINTSYYQALTATQVLGTGKAGVALVLAAINKLQADFYAALSDHSCPILSEIKDKLGLEVTAQDLFSRREVPVDISDIGWIFPTENQEATEVTETLQVAPAHPVRSAWQRSSYSAIVRNMEKPLEDDIVEEKEDSLTQTAEIESAEIEADENDILSFTRGPESGTFLHALFEHIDFAMVRAAFDGDEKAAQKLKARIDILSRPHEHNFKFLSLTMFERLLIDVLCTPIIKAQSLGTQTDLRLCDIPEAARMHEMTFTMSLQGQTRARDINVLELAELLRAFDAKFHLGAIPPKNLTGFLNGAIDMVFTHEGRFFVADWKSNFLGTHPEDYSASAMRRAMAHHQYHLQYLIYCVALKRYLANRGIALSTENFGGVIYAFIRGIRQESPTGQGVYFTRVPLALIDALDDFFANGFNEKRIAYFADLALNELPYDR